MCFYRILLQFASHSILVFLQFSSMCFYRILFPFAICFYSILLSSALCFYSILAFFNVLQQYVVIVQDSNWQMLQSWIRSFVSIHNPQRYGWIKEIHFTSLLQSAHICCFRIDLHMNYFLHQFNVMNIEHIRWHPGIRYQEWQTSNVCRCRICMWEGFVHYLQVR